MIKNYLNHLINKASERVDLLIDAYLRKERFFEFKERPLVNLWIGITIVRGIVVIPISFLLFVDGNIRNNFYLNASLFLSYTLIQLGIYLRTKFNEARFKKSGRLFKGLRALDLKWHPPTFLFIITILIDLVFYFYIIFQTNQIYYDTHFLLFIPIIMISFYSRSIRGMLLNIVIALFYFLSFIFLTEGQHLLKVFLRAGSFIFLGGIVGLYHFLLDRLFIRQNDLFELDELKLKLSKTFNIAGTEVQAAKDIVDIIVNQIDSRASDRLCAGIFAAYHWSKTLKLKGVTGWLPKGVSASYIFKFGEGIIGSAAEKKATAYSDDVMTDPACSFFRSSILPSNYNRLALIAIPLLDNENNLLGVLVVGKYYNDEKKPYTTIFNDNFLGILFRILQTISIHYANSVYVLKGRRNQYIFKLRRKMDDLIQTAMEKDKTTSALMYEIGEILQEEIKADKVVYYEYDESLECLTFKAGNISVDIPIQLKKADPIFTQILQISPDDVLTRENASIFPKNYQTYTLMPIWNDRKLAALYVFLRVEERRKSDFQVPAHDRRLLYPELLLTKIYDKLDRAYRNSFWRETIRMKDSQLDLVLNELQNNFLKLDQEQILQETTKFAKDIFQAEAATIYLVDEQKHKLILKHVHGFEKAEEIIDKHSYQINNHNVIVGLPTYVFFHPKTPLVARTPSEFKGLPSLSGRLIEYYKTLPYYQNLSDEEKKTSFGVGSYIGVAITSTNTPKIVLGVLQIYNKRRLNEEGDASFLNYTPFLPSDTRHLEKLAAIIATALEYAIGKEKITKEREYFASNTSVRLVHELRQPVASLFMLNKTLEKLREKNISPHDQTALLVLDRVRNAVEKISDISSSINDAFAFIEIKRTSTDVNALVRTAAEENDRLMKNKQKIKTVIDCPNDGLKISIDPLKIQQVLHNLINNAVDAMSTGGTLYLRTRTSDDKLIIEVEDNGLGIPKSIQQQIFMPYETTKAPSAGMGIGLTVALNIVKAHNGDLVFESQEGKGSLFKIILPVHNVKPAEEKNHE